VGKKQNKRATNNPEDGNMFLEKEKGKDGQKMNRESTYSTLFIFETIITVFIITSSSNLQLTYSEHQLKYLQNKTHRASN
jgi:hypothetical protein